MPLDFSRADGVYIIDSPIHDIKGDNNVQNPSPDAANCTNNNPTAESSCRSTNTASVKKLLKYFKTKKPRDQDAELPVPVSNSTTQDESSKTDIATSPEGVLKRAS